MHAEDMRVNWMPFHLLGERFDCIFNVGGYKHDRMSSRAAIVATVALACRHSFFFFGGGVRVISSYLGLKIQFSCGHTFMVTFVKS